MGRDSQPPPLRGLFIPNSASLMSLLQLLPEPFICVFGVVISFYSRHHFGAFSKNCTSLKILLGARMVKYLNLLNGQTLVVNCLPSL